MKRALLAGGSAGLLGLGAAAALPALAADGTVASSCCSYSPDTVTIKAGESVTFKPGLGNDFEGSGPMHHPLDFVDPSIADQTSGSAPATRVFPTAGTYAFFCQVHGSADGSGMAGKVIVEPGGGGAGGDGMVTTQVTPEPLSAAAAAPSAIRVTRLRSSGLVVTVRTNDAAVLSATLRRAGRTLARASGVAEGAGDERLTLRATKAGRQARPSAAGIAATLTVTARAADGRTATSKRSVQLRR